MILKALLQLVAILTHISIGSVIAVLSALWCVDQINSTDSVPMIVLLVILGVTPSFILAWTGERIVAWMQR
jgi:hypothetical protein